MKLKDGFTLDDLIKGIATELDYDIAKDLFEETAEEPEFVEVRMSGLRTIARQFFEKEQNQ